MTEPDLGARLADIVEDAGRLILPLWRAGVEVSRKADDSPVTEADRRAEGLILDRLSKAFPEVPIISEEDAAEFGTPQAIGPRFFLVDPLDGTKAFVRRDPNFTVNIGLVDQGRPIAGAVAAPAMGESWYADHGGAFRRRIGDQVSWPIRVRRPGASPLALISHTMAPDTLLALRERYGFGETQAMDSSVKLCRIAEGSADIYPRHGPTMEWDIAAGHAVLEAAGGALTDPYGKPFVYGKAAEGFRNGWFVARGAS
jgi:3'(2'), 5'-bisphosphate nucleotidase